MLPKAIQKGALIASQARVGKPSCAMKVDIHLPSGDGVSLEVSPAAPISELKAAA